MMRLDRPQLRHLLVLLSRYRHDGLTTAEERELRDIVRGQGYGAEADAKDLRPVADLGKGILFAYHVLEGIHIDSLVDDAGAQPA